MALAIFSLALFLVPAFIIRPFTHQSDIGLRLALFVKWIAPTLTLLALLAVIALAWLLWQKSSRLFRSRDHHIAGALSGVGSDGA